jgi:hypothetical protein
LTSGIGNSFYQVEEFAAARIAHLSSARLIGMITQHAVQVECGADQRKMSEGLRKIAQSLTLRTGLF